MAEDGRAGGGGRDELVFLPLGGIGEIGMNCYLYGLGPADARQWLMVDLGLTFPEGENDPGVDVILPDLRYIEAERGSVAGLVLTHAHEDHFGAVIELWPRLRVPIYATPFTAALLKAKVAEFGRRRELPIEVVPLNGRFDVGPFRLELIEVAHSIPESNALVLRTPLGTVLHSGDWKLDPTPTVGGAAGAARFAALGAEGVLALVCDSTNAMRDGRSPSEEDVARTSRLEPPYGSFTKTGKPSVASIHSGSEGGTIASGATSTPAPRTSCFVRILSIASAEPLTPLPV